MKQKPRWTLEMLIAALAVLCALLTLALLVQRPAGWPALAVLVVLWGIGICVFRYQLRRWTAKWVAGGSFENSRTQYSLESLSQPAALLSGETVLWYNSRFRTALLGGEDRLAGRAQKLLPGLDTAQARTPEGQQLNLADGVWNVHSSTVPGGSESMTLLVFNEETALRRIETEYKASRPGYMVFLVDGYDDVFSDMLDSERARLLEGINRVLEDMIGRGTGFLRRVASGRYIAVVEERHLEQYAKRGYDVTVYEASDHLGGQIVLAAAPPRKDEIMRSVEYYEKILPGLGVKVELNHAATAEDLNAADAAIVAVGAHDVVIPVPGADSDKVVSSWDVLAGKVELAGRVAVIGGGLVGTETAEYLLQHGCEVAIVEMLDKIAAGESETILPLIMSDFAEHNVEQHVKTRLTAITDEGVEAVRTTEDGAEEPVKIACDYVVMAVGSKANAFDLDGVTVPVTCVGDCSVERTADIASAIRTAYHAANEL